MSDDRPKEPGTARSIFSMVTNVKPGLYIVKFWQGIVDIVIRGSVAILALVCLVAGASYGGDITAQFNGLSAPGGWLSFVGFVVMVIELVVIAMRFVNFQLVLEYSLLVMIVNLVYCGIAIAAVFAGFVPCAVYAGQFQHSATLNAPATGLQGAAIKAGFAAAFAFILLAVLVVEIVYAVLWHIMKWFKPLGGSYDVSEAPE